MIDKRRRKKPSSIMAKSMRSKTRGLKTKVQCTKGKELQRKKGLEMSALFNLCF